MLLIVLLLCTILSAIVLLGRRDSLAACLLAMNLSAGAMLVGVVIYIAQLGGISAAQARLLFLTKDIREALRYLPIQLDKLGYVVALGRTLFPMFALLLALDASNARFVRRNLKLFRRCAVIPAAALLVYYFPPVFHSLTEGRFRLMLDMMTVSLVIILCCLLLTVLLLMVEETATSISFYRKKTGYLFGSVLGMSLLYAIYATKDPTQIYHYYITEYIQYGVSSYLSASLTEAGWTIVGSLSIAFVLLGSYGMLRYAQMEYDEDRQNFKLQRKFEMINNDTAVFVHGIKNQLLTCRVLLKKMDQLLAGEEPDVAALRELTAQLKTLNESMHARMGEMNQSVRNNALVLVPVSVRKVIRSAVERFASKYPDVDVEVICQEDLRILADVPHLAEAISNLLTNGYEAAVLCGARPPKVCVTVRQERLWTVLEIRDNGGGISAQQRKKIFKPAYSGKNESVNWGMGLFYARRIVKNHFGRLRLESSEGEGTVFHLMLPRYDTGGNK